MLNHVVVLVDARRGFIEFISFPYTSHPVLPLGFRLAYYHSSIIVHGWFFFCFSICMFMCIIMLTSCWFGFSCAFPLSILYFFRLGFVCVVSLPLFCVGHPHRMLEFRFSCFPFVSLYLFGFCFVLSLFAIVLFRLCYYSIYLCPNTRLAVSWHRGEGCASQHLVCASCVSSHLFYASRAASVTAGRTIQLVLASLVFTVIQS